MKKQTIEKELIGEIDSVVDISENREIPTVQELIEKELENGEESND